MTSRHIAFVLLAVVLFASSACRTGRADPSSTDPSPTATRTLRPTYTPAQAKGGEVVASPSAEPGNQAFLPFVMGGEESASPTPTVVPPTPAAEASENRPKQMVLRDDLPALTLPEWPRPANDNGRCMHFLRSQYYTEQELDLNIARLQQLGAKWTLVVYGDENMLHRAAPRFAAAGIVPVWRKMLRPDEPYFNWQRDIEIVTSYGLPPYFQLYNEPSLAAEWDERAPDEDDRERFLDNLMQATQDVYNAGGFVGWQFINEEWLKVALDELEQRGGQRVLGRFFFIPHSYGLNHPPNYTEDVNGVLGFLFFARIFQERYGSVPPFIVGEGGWKINNDADARFPPIDDTLHRDYHVELFLWFKNGVLSNGEPLPDYLFAFCPWLLAAKMDDNAWWDSFAGDRALTIEAVSNLPPFVRRFSWEE